MLAYCLVACDSPANKRGNEYPMFWTWLDYRPGMNFDSICSVMNEVGIEGVMLNAPTPDDYRVAIPIAHKYGIEVYAWIWTLNLEHDRERIVREHPEWLSVNRDGKSLADNKAYVNHYKFMCPALPEVREFIKNKIESYCEVEGLNGIAIDYNRLVDVILPTSLWPLYGIVQDREYAEWDYGYHPAMIEEFKKLHGYDPMEQKDPSQDMKWLQFRCDKVTEVANMIADVVHSHGKVMAASPFPTPRMSKQMVRQDWGKWNLDIVFPMVYHNFYTKDVSFVSDCTMENVRDKNPNTKLYCGLMVGDDIEEAMDAALNYGSEGISIFTVSALKSPESRAKFKAYTDSVKALRAENDGVNLALVKNGKISEPFENMHLLGLINDKIKEQAGVPIPNIMEYKLVKEEGTTKYYEVKEQNSGKFFCVDLYFYGGILSGWNVKEKETE